MDQSLIINGWGIHDLARWLKHHGPAKLRGYYEHLKVEKDPKMVEMGYIFVEGTLRGPRELNYGVIELECKYCYVNEEDYSAIDHRRYPAVQFKLEPLTPSTTKLFYTSYHRTLDPIVDALLEELLIDSRPDKPTESNDPQYGEPESRGPNIGTVDRCLEAMEYWLDKDKFIKEACELAGVHRDTMHERIPLVLERLNSEKRDRWIELIKDAKKEKYLGKFR